MPTPRRTNQSTEPRARRERTTTRARASEQEPTTARRERAATSRAADRERAATSPRPRKQTPATMQVIAKWRSWGVAAFAALMVAGCIIGLLFFARPTTSDYEKRNLTPFPAITVESFLDGSFFSDVSLWYADTYPLREPLVKMDHAIDSLFGIQTETQMIGGNVQADELPPAGATTVEPEHREEVDQPTAQTMQEDIQGNIMNGLYVQGNKACSVYYFYEPAVATYAAALNTCAAQLDGIATVYSVLIPNNSGATLDEEILAQLGGTDQKEALDYYHSIMDERIRVVETYDALRAHRDEYIYFNTDHHWTQLGAYYAYVEFCKKKGIEPSDISTWEQHDYGPFLGSFYQELELQAMADDPDVVHVYVPTGTNDMTYWNEYGEFEGYIIEDATDYGENSKYMCFVYGNQPRNKIVNPKVTDGSSCLVVIDSYGCAFVPCLVDNYQTIWFTDCRYGWDNIPQFAKDNGIQDVIFMNNMTIAGTETVADNLYYLCNG